MKRGIWYFIEGRQTMPKTVGARNCVKSRQGVSVPPTEEKSLCMADSTLPSSEGFFNSYRHQNLTGGKESGKS